MILKEAIQKTARTRFHGRFGGSGSKVTGVWDEAVTAHQLGFLTRQDLLRNGPRKASLIFVNRGNRHLLQHGRILGQALDVAIVYWLSAGADGGAVA